jgi:phage shock protein A
MTGMSNTCEQVNKEVDVLNQALERMQQEMDDQRVQIATLIAVQSRRGLEPRN